MTKTIPIVFWGVAFPVEHGLVASYRRPGGNVTGFGFSAGPEIVTKQLELLKAIAPSTKRVAGISGRSSSEHVDGHRISLPVLASPFRPLSMEGQRFPIESREDLPRVLASIREWRADAIFAFGDPATMNERHALADFARRHRLVSGFGMKEYVLAGGLFSYGPDTADTVRRSAAYIDRILKGANPAELPVEQPSTFQLIINLRTARGIGLSVSAGPSPSRGSDHRIGRTDMKTVGWPALFGCLVLFGCATARTSPPTVDVTGEWVGQWVNLAFSYSGGMTLMLKQVGGVVTGEIVILPASLGTSGPVHGSIEGNVLSFTYRGGGGHLNVQGDEMSGQSLMGSALTFRRR